MIKTGYSVLIILVGMMGAMVYAGETSATLKETHGTIGKKLIKMRYDVPTQQETVYSILGEVDRMYKLACRTNERRKQQKLIVMNEQQTVAAQRKEIDRLENLLNLKQKQLQDSRQQLDAVRADQSALESKNRRLENRVNSLESAVAGSVGIDPSVLANQEFAKLEHTVDSLQMAQAEQKSGVQGGVEPHARKNA